MHHYCVYALACAAGIGSDRAYVIAQASQLTDDWNNADKPYHAVSARSNENLGDFEAEEFSVVKMCYATA